MSSLRNRYCQEEIRLIRKYIETLIDKMRSATTIEFFKNLAQYDFDGRYYDFHSDYGCDNLSYSNEVLSISFKSLMGGFSLSLKFTEVEIVTLNFANVKEFNSLTLDNLYRGRLEHDGELIEISGGGKGYFYLEFYEGQNLEFWANGVYVEHE